MIEAITISALNKYVRSLLESDPVLTDIALRGEVSNFSRHHKTGHCYFSLKDGKASVKAVMFRSDAENQAFLPENGMRVVARGRISLYERDGAFQVYVEYLFPDGVGAAQMAFEQLKQRLEAEGLFAPEAKRMLPEYPGVVGLVTSKTGAALQDILRVARRRCPAARFFLAPVSVQGQQAAGEIAAAIKRLDGRVDAIIVARGGGSAEDLWVFNAEEIARAAFACQTPLVSAIGHEVDYTILDFVADLRAPTPSAAAEMVLPDLAETRRRMLYLFGNISNNIHHRWESCYNRWAGCRAHPALAAMGGRPAMQRQRLRAAAAAMRKAAGGTLKRAEGRLGAASALAAGLNPYAVLARGYGIARAGGTALRSVAQATPGQPMELTLQDGALDCTVDAVRPAKGEGYGREPDRL